MPKPKIKLAFLDHSYHFKTRSGDFLQDIFKSGFFIKFQVFIKTKKIVVIINLYILTILIYKYKFSL